MGQNDDGTLHITGSLIDLAEFAAGLEEPRQFWGYEALNATGMLSGTLYPLLQRLTTAEKGGWLKRIEPPPPPPGPRPAKRPPRKYFEVTPAGVTGFAGVLSVARARKLKKGTLRRDRA